MPFVPISKWFFSLTLSIRTVIVGLIAMILLWAFVTPFYLEFRDILQNQGISEWWIVVIAAAGLAIFATYGKNLLKV